MLSPYFHLLGDDPARAPSDPLPAGPAEGDAAPAPSAPRKPTPRSSRSSWTSPRAPGPWRRALVEEALAPDLTYQRAGSLLRAAYDPPFFATYVYGLDVAGHAFFRYAHPDRFGDVRPADVAPLRPRARPLPGPGGPVGRRSSAQGLRPGEVLFVVSGYGMEPVPLVAAPAQRSSRRRGRERDARRRARRLPARRGRRHPGGGEHPEQASVLDLAPTILYLFGLPVARDMEGRVLTEILDDGLRARATRSRSSPATRAWPSAPVAAEPPPLEDLPPAARGGPVRRLVLFDIDGTLLSAGGVSARAFESGAPGGLRHHGRRRALRLLGQDGSADRARADARGRPLRRRDRRAHGHPARPLPRAPARVAAARARAAEAGSGGARGRARRPIPA